MSYLDIVNYLRISDLDRGSKNQEKLDDLRERAGQLARKTGQEPASWYEFKQTAKTEEPKTLRDMLAGSAIGLAIGAVVGLMFMDVIVPIAIAGALVGAAVGGFSDTDNVRRRKQVDQYEKYLDAFEISTGKARGLSETLGGDMVKTTHAADLLAERQQAVQLVRT